jgi:hypothetical protein
MWQLDEIDWFHETANYQNSTNIVFTTWILQKLLEMDLTFKKTLTKKAVDRHGVTGEFFLLHIWRFKTNFTQSRFILKYTSGRKTSVSRVLKLCPDSMIQGKKDENAAWGHGHGKGKTQVEPSPDDTRDRLPRIFSQ